MATNAAGEDFSNTFGLCVCTLAWAGLLFGLRAFKEAVPRRTSVGFGLTSAGGLFIRFAAPP